MTRRNGRRQPQSRETPQLLVRPPRAIDRDAAIEGVIFQPQPAALSLDDLRARLGPVVQRWLGPVVRRDSAAEPGRFRYVAFIFEPARNVRVFVQFWSEPLQPVCWQVSSGRTDRPTQRWLGADRWERIRTFGFEIGGDAENFETHVCIGSTSDLNRVALTVVDLLFSALDYHGQQPLMVELGAGQHAPAPQVFDSLTPAQVVELMAGLGQTMLSYEDGEDTATLHFRKRGIATTVELSERRPDTRSFAVLGLTCDLEPSPSDLARLIDATRSLTPPGAVPVVRLGTTLQLGGGVTMEWLRRRVGEWNAMTRRYRLEQRNQTLEPRALPRLVSDRVH